MFLRSVPQSLKPPDALIGLEAQVADQADADELPDLLAEELTAAQPSDQQAQQSHQNASLRAEEARHARHHLNNK